MNRDRAPGPEPGPDTLTYVYAVVAPASGLERVTAGLRGVGDAPVVLLAGPRADGATVDDGPSAPVFVGSRVPCDAWQEAALTTRFEDLAWLEATARAHHHVVQALAAHTTVLPLRLATLYQDDERALAALDEQRGTFAAGLARLAGHTEYGVKVYLRPEVDAPAPDAVRPASSAPAAPAPGTVGRASATSPGKAYLRARRADRLAREEHRRQAGLAAERIAAAAGRHAAGVVRHPAQTGPLTRAETGENVLNEAYLVPDDRAAEFRAAVGAAGGDLPAVRVEVTGPWAPYSFAAPGPGPGPAPDPAPRPASEPDPSRDRDPGP
ncbi:GvpL/GvpF family gas vesicle protein [Streptomyces sp. NPDC093225]|uniref:GvpL/GvpF family gas vesicle protein n=1 Tax=Streptomyces sp. NPDC093225 TaxID=3366034 RepID=UPI0038160976